MARPRRVRVVRVVLRVVENMVDFGGGCCFGKWEQCAGERRDLKVSNE